MAISKRLTVERVVPLTSLSFSYLDHIARYEFIKNMVANKVVLDAGCGNGYGTYMLAKVVQKIIGVDIASEAIAYAKKNFVAQNLNFIQMDCQNLKFDDSSFDMVCSFDVIEHIENYQSYLSGLNRILRKSGILAISTPNNKNNQHPPANPFHKKEFAYQEFKLLLNKYFNVIDFYGETPDKDLKNAVGAFKKFYNPVNKFDFFKFRRVIPRKIRERFIRLFIKMGGIDISDLTPNNITFRSENIENSSILFALCQKG